VKIVADTSLAKIPNIGDCTFTSENDVEILRDVDIIILLGGDGTLLHLNSKLQGMFPSKSFGVFFFFFFFSPDYLML
jgi:NAD kinase